MSKVLPFLGGCIVSGVLVLNHTYENERLKQEVQHQINMLKQMKDFEIGHVAKFRKHDHAHRRLIEANGSVADQGLDDLQTHYHYFQGCSINALRESFFGFSPTPYLLRAKVHLQNLYNQNQAEAVPATTPAAPVAQAEKQPEPETQKEPEKKVESEPTKTIENKQ